MSWPEAFLKAAEMLCFCGLAAFTFWLIMRPKE